MFNQFGVVVDGLLVSYAELPEFELIDLIDSLKREFWDKPASISTISLSFATCVLLI